MRGGKRSAQDFLADQRAVTEAASRVMEITIFTDSPLKLFVAKFTL
jgi:hypothetical protein